MLFIDARKLGRMVDRTHRELTDEDIRKIADTYHAWRTVGAMHASPRLEYRDLPGFCKRATLDEIRTHGYILKPGRYVGAPEQQQDDEPFEAPMSRLVAQLRQQQSEARRLKNFKELGYEA